MATSDVPQAIAATDDPTAVVEAELPPDDLFHVLQNERRRRVLRYLLANGEGPHEMRTVAESVAASEYDTTVRQLAADQRKRVYVSLYQSHLPKLDDFGVIDYDRDRGRVRRSWAFDQVVDSLPDRDDAPGADADGADERSDGGEDAGPSATVPRPWRDGYVGVTALAVVLVASAGVAPPVSGLYVAALVLALFGTVTAGMVWSTHEAASTDDGSR